MRIPRIAFFGIFLGASSVSAVLHAESDIINEVIAFAARPLAEQTLANLPKGREQETLQAMGRKGSGFIEQAIRLNFQPAIDREVAVYAKVEGKDAYLRKIFENSGSPFIFDELAAMLYKGDELKQRSFGEGHYDLGESASTAILFGNMIQRVPEFSGVQKEWARGNLTRTSPNLIRNARDWWEINRLNLAANRFSELDVPVGSSDQGISKRVAALVTTKRDFVPEKENQTMREGKISIRVSGWAVCAGEYHLPAGSRVIDALEAAGGIKFPNNWKYNSMFRKTKDGIKKNESFGKDRLSDCKTPLQDGDVIVLSDIDF